MTQQLGAAVDHLLSRIRVAGAIRDQIEADHIQRLVVGTAHALRTFAEDAQLVSRYL